MLAHLGALTTKAKVESVPCSPLGSSTRILEANREKWVNHFTPRTIIILMRRIKDLYQTSTRPRPRPICKPMLLRPAYLSQKLDQPLPTKDGGTLRTSRDACDYMTGMDKKRELRSQ